MKPTEQQAIQLRTEMYRSVGLDVREMVKTVDSNLPSERCVLLKAVGAFTALRMIMYAVDHNYCCPDCGDGPIPQTGCDRPYGCALMQHLHGCIQNRTGNLSNYDENEDAPGMGKDALYTAPESESRIGWSDTITY